MTNDGVVTARELTLFTGLLFLIATSVFAQDRPLALDALEKVGWRVDRAKDALPPLQLRWSDELETHRFVQFVYEGGALRLIAGPDGRSVFALLVDARAPRYTPYAGLSETPRHEVHRDDPYVVVLRKRPVDQKTFERLRSRRWTEHDLLREIGPVSSHGHWHGIGFFDLTYVPEGLYFVGDRRKDAPIEYQLFESGDPNDFTAELPPIEYVSDLAYEPLQDEVRKRFALKLIRDRREIDGALEHGQSSPGGRFVLGRVNLAGTYNNEEVVIRERGMPERRYHAGYFTKDQDYAWLNDRTALYRLSQPTGDVEFHSIDAVTGTTQQLAKVSYEEPHRVTGFGVSGSSTFWYTTDDGVRHEVPVRTK